MNEELLDDIEYADLFALLEIAKPETIIALRENQLNQKQKFAVEIVDELFSKVSKTTDPLTVYIEFPLGSLDGVSTITDKAYLAGSLTKPSTTERTVLSFIVPVGKNVLYLDQTTVLFERGQSLNIDNSEPNPVATLLNNQATVRFYLDSSEFHLTGKHDQSAHAKGGSSKTSSGGDEKQKMSKKKKIIIGAIIAAVVIGAIVTGVVVKKKRDEKAGIAEQKLIAEKKQKSVESHNKMLEGLRGDKLSNTSQDILGAAWIKMHGGKLEENRVGIFGDDALDIIGDKIKAEGWTPKQTKDHRILSRLPKGMPVE